MTIPYNPPPSIDTEPIQYNSLPLLKKGEIAIDDRFLYLRRENGIIFFVNDEFVEMLLRFLILIHEAMEHQN